MKMRRIVLLALVLMLASTAVYAQEYYTLAELREQAAEGWHQTYTDRYGREIVVDIETPVYGFDRAPILKIVLRERYSYTDNSPLEDAQNIRRKCGGKREYACELYGQKVDLDMAYGKSYGSDITLREVYGYLTTLLEDQGDDSEAFLYDLPKALRVQYTADKKGKEVLSPPVYSLMLWQTFYGLPVITHAMMGFEMQGTPVYLPQLVFDYLNQEEYGIGILTMKEEAVITEDVPVCSFDQVISNLEEQIEKGYIQKVVSLRFGYAVYNNPLPASETPRSAFDAECYYAVPSWIVECVFAVNPKKDIRDSEKTRIITINAQSGEMLDVFDKSKGGRGNADYKGFIPLDDVR